MFTEILNTVMTLFDDPGRVLLIALPVAVALSLLKFEDKLNIK